MLHSAVFPSRTSTDREETIGRKEKLFEIFSGKPIKALENTNFEESIIDGNRVIHYDSVLDAEKLVEVIEELNIFQSHARDIAHNVIDPSNEKHRIPKIMGIVNVTPDSFYPGSRMMESDFPKIDSILDEKPDIIDIGAESTRPGSKPISTEEEISRILPIVKHVRETSDISISIDTRNPETIRRVLEFDIQYLNDITGFRNPEMAEIARENRMNCIIMHMRGTPENMQELTAYDDTVFQIISFLSDRASALINRGIDPKRIIVDPGVGFAKDLNGNMEIFNNIRSFKFGFDLLVGASRKSFIGNITGESVDKRLPGTIASSIYLAENGTDILRVHDVSENRSALKVYQWLTKGRIPHGPD